MSVKTAAAVALVRRFVEVDPQQAAGALEALAEADAAALVKGLPDGAAASLLERVRPPFAAALLSALLPEPGSGILRRMEADHAAAALRAMSDEQRQAALAAQPEEVRRELVDLLGYPPHSAGGLMTTDVFSVNTETKVREVIARLRSSAGRSSDSYVYAVGPDRKLQGVVNMRDLLLASPEATVASMMRADVLAVPAMMDREDLVHMAGETHFLSMPVVDAQGRLVGRVRTSALLETSQQEATEDVQKLFGASAEERAFSPLFFKVRQRLPWLQINLATAFLAASVVAHFQDLIGRVAVLAVFLPIVAGQGGNAGIQTLAVALRGLVMREVRPRDAAALIAVEAGTALVNGLAVGLVTAGAAWLWKGNPWLGLVVGLAMVLNMAAAGIAGAGIPLAMKRLGFDPAQSSGIFLTTVTDVVGFLTFLGFAALFEARLL